MPDLTAFFRASVQCTCATVHAFDGMVTHLCNAERFVPKYSGAAGCQSVDRKFAMNTDADASAVLRPGVCGKFDVLRAWNLNRRTYTHRPPALRQLPRSVSESRGGAGAGSQQGQASGATTSTAIVVFFSPDRPPTSVGPKPQLPCVPCSAEALWVRVDPVAGPASLRVAARLPFGPGGSGLWSVSYSQTDLTGVCQERPAARPLWVSSLDAACAAEDPGHGHG
eukprot:CAMPEP_0174308828 /NCGR_PEP_ID=MMETSP0810-20121108/2007_1 /TAXON_ID=73025 ORGANISM="Eutreptiella gymnastica-like, Strain CCMP1594" /NCGR_SAMPLE_ID=MMETSP0810 /ASSEMBLY_ACC=CAM_ASM_000659 /LENGTH=223 /DNA_ID=CAMNT_0015416265 /DNA_START=435 /DNA_END=1107 /DNA_ORIENTATION=-